MCPDNDAPLTWVYCKSAKFWAPFGLPPTARVFDTGSVKNRAAALPAAPNAWVMWFHGGLKRRRLPEHPTAARPVKQSAWVRKRLAGLHAPPMRQPYYRDAFLPGDGKGRGGRCSSQLVKFACRSQGSTRHLMAPPRPVRSRVREASGHPSQANRWACVDLMFQRVWHPAANEQGGRRKNHGIGVSEFSSGERPPGTVVC